MDIESEKISSAPTMNLESEKTSTIITSDSPTPSTTPPTISKNQRNKARHDQLFSHGNYHNYYSFRVQQIPDPRLTLLTAYFAGASVLDLGCNAGKLTRETLTHLSASSTLGVDLDPVLIAQATSTALPPNCNFKLQDFLQRPATIWTDGRRFDVVLLLSVTKWIHLNAGDEGLMGLFRELWESVLEEGGVLVVEPQEWGNYKTAVKKATGLRERFKALRMRPPFKEELREVGFVLEREIEREEGGFSRPLHAWRRKGPAVIRG